MTRFVGSSSSSSYHNRRPSPFSIQSSSSPTTTLTLTSNNSNKNASNNFENEDYWSTPGLVGFQAASKVKQFLEDQPWYHGRIKRINAINLLKYDGDFLVRDSISNPGDYVLTGLCRDEPMHFEIHRAPSSDPKIDLYYFEDEQFRSVVDLIQFYVNHRRQVTSKSQFTLLNPVTNTEKHELPYNKYQMEIEATYAPFINKQAQLSARYDRSLSQKTLINQAKKRLNGSEHDLMHLLAASSSTSNQLTSSKSFGQLYKTSSSPPENDTPKISYKKNINNGNSNSSNGNGIKVTSFGVDENNGFCVEKTFVPPKSSRPIPKFPPPKSPIAYPEDLDDYDDVDYEAMEEEQNRFSSTSASSTSPSSTIPLIRSPPTIPPKPLSLLKQKRNSEFIDSSKVPESHQQQQQFIDPNRKHSAHSLFQPSNNRNSNNNDSDDLESPEDPLPAYLDRTQSCQNLVYRQRTKCGKEIISGMNDEEESFRRYPSVKIDPPPMLPTRSKESLCSLSALAVAERKSGKNNESSDYDDVKVVEENEPDYDKVKAKPAEFNLPPVQSPPEPLQSRPKNLAQLRAMSNPPKQIRHLLNYFASLTIEKLSLLITSEDIKVFNLSPNKTSNGNNNNAPINALKKLFMAESRILREEVLDRNACLQLTVSMTIQKAHNPRDIIKIWISAASNLLHKIGNGFSFGAIMAAIISEKQKHSNLFAHLEPTTMAHLKRLIPIYDDFIGGKMPPSIAGCFLPFIQPLLQLFSASDYVQANKLKNINSNGLDNLEILSNMIHLVRHILFENCGNLEESIESSKMNGPNPFSTEALIHCLLGTPSLSTEPKESERRKIRQMFEQNN